MSTLKRRSGELLEIARNFRAHNSETDVVIHQYLSSLDCPRALTVWLLYKNQEHDQLTALECHPEDYGDNPFAFRHAYFATCFLSKSSFLKTTFDRKEVALKKFLQYEELCMETNRRFVSPLLDPKNTGSNVWLLSATIRKIEEILGDYSGDEFVDGSNWGPGVSTQIKGEHTSATNKFQNESGITRDLYSLVSPWFATAYPLWSEHLSSLFGKEAVPVFEVGNNIVTVPKNSKSDRVIAIEPGINLWFQKSIGTMIRRRLARFGVDLNSQSRNQQLAWSGSCTGKLATVDFSSASDSIALELVRVLMPPRWFQLMDACRSKVGTSEDSGPRTWCKFSSMGNGFTFELESLIFYAAALAVAEHPSIPFRNRRLEINVFGDDVIIPVECFDLFSQFSDFLGFRVNRLKSFSTSYFRESCGSHFFWGITAKPIYLKERLRYVESFFKLANSVRHLAHRCNFNRSCDNRFLNCWTHLFNRVPEPLRFLVPSGRGDSGFAVNFDEAKPSRARYGIEGYFYQALSSTGITTQSDQTGLLLARLWVPSIQEYGNTYTLRGRVRRTLIRPLVQLWYNLGEWS